LHTKVNYEFVFVVCSSNQNYVCSLPEFCFTDGYLGVPGTYVPHYCTHYLSSVQSVKINASQ